MKKLLIALVMVIPMAVGATTLEEHEKRWGTPEHSDYLRGLAAGARNANVMSMTENNRYLFCPPKDWDGDDIEVAAVVKQYANDYPKYPIEYIFIYGLRKLYPCQNQNVFPTGK